MTSETPLGSEIAVTPLGEEWHIGHREELARTLGLCPDVAFAYLAEVRVGGQDKGTPVVFVWLRPNAMRSMRAALNLVSEIVANVIPGSAFVDVVILNSAPELLSQAEAAETLLIEVDADERQRALAAALEAPSDDLPTNTRQTRWWWPF